MTGGPRRAGSPNTSCRDAILYPQFVALEIPFTNIFRRLTSLPFQCANTGSTVFPLIPLHGRNGLKPTFPYQTAGVQRTHDPRRGERYCHPGTPSTTLSRSLEYLLVRRVSHQSPGKPLPMRFSPLPTDTGTYLALACFFLPLMASRISATMVLDGAPRYAPKLAGVPPRALPPRQAETPTSWDAVSNVHLILMIFIWPAPRSAAHKVRSQRPRSLAPFLRCKPAYTRSKRYAVHGAEL